MRKAHLIILVLLILCAFSTHAQTITTSFLQVSTPTCAASAFQNVPFSCQISPTGGIPPYSFTLNSGGGSGLSMSTGSGGGLISGTPTGTSLVNFSITVADSGNSSQQVTIGVTPGALSSITVTPINTAVAASGTLQMAALGTFSNGGTDLSSLATWSCTGTPCGTVSSSGLFTAGASGGTATIKAVFNSITDDGGAGVAVTVSTTTPVITTSSLCTGQIYQAFPEAAAGCAIGQGQQILCSSGTPPYTFALGTLTLQTGLTLSSGGLLSGTPSASGTKTGTITCTDAVPHVGTSSSLSLVVASLSSLTVALAPSSITFPQTSQATATGTYSDSTTATLPNNAIAWTSGTTSCATVNGSGVVTALNVAAGCTSVITATVGATSNTATVTVGAVASGSASLLQNSILNTCTSGTSACTVTLKNTTTTGTALICYANNLVGGSAITLSSCTDGGDTFSSCTTLGGTTCNASVGSADSTSMMAILSGAGGKTSVTCNTSASSTSAWTCGLLEFSTTSSGFAFDVSGNISNSSSTTTAAGTALTFTGTNDIVVRNIIVPGGGVNSMTGGYTLNADSHGNAEPYIVNTGTGSAPTYTFSTSTNSAEGAIALKQPGSPGTTRVAATCNPTDVMAKVALSANGDTVQLPANSVCTWAPGTTTNNTGVVHLDNTKQITLDGNGSTITFSGHGTSGGGFENPVLSVVTGNSNAAGTGTVSNTVIKNFTFVGGYTAPGEAIVIVSAPGNLPYRLTNNTFNTVDGTVVYLYGCGGTQGLLDHNAFTATNNIIEITHNFGCIDPNGNAGNQINDWSSDVVPGGPNFIFYENNTFNGPATNPASAEAVENFNGARIVFRHNTLNNVDFDSHGNTSGVNTGTGGCFIVNTRWYEVYQNTWNLTVASDLPTINVRGGSGVIWGNTHAGPNGGIQIQADCSSTNSGVAYPYQDQDGRGITTSSGSSATNASPIYTWNNSGFNAPNIASHDGLGTTYIVTSRDYFNSASQPSSLNRCESANDVTSGCPFSYTYVPYQYPHPLDH